MSYNEGGKQNDTPGALRAPGAHPLAMAAAQALGGGSAPARILLVGIGSGRNIPVLLAAGARIDAVDDDPARANAATRRFARETSVRIALANYTAAPPYPEAFTAVLSTHAFLHGSPEDIARAIAVAWDCLLPGGWLFATLGSKRDPRFGAGIRVASDTFAPENGSEAGVAHGYFDALGVRKLLGRFDIEEMVERDGGEAVGRWAHSENEAASIVHWWIRARRQ